MMTMTMQHLQGRRACTANTASYAMDIGSCNSSIESCSERERALLEKGNTAASLVEAETDVVVEGGVDEAASDEERELKKKREQVSLLLAYSPQCALLSLAAHYRRALSRLPVRPGRAEWSSGSCQGGTSEPVACTPCALLASCSLFLHQAPQREHSAE